MAAVAEETMVAEVAEAEETVAAEVAEIAEETAAVEAAEAEAAEEPEPAEAAEPAVEADPEAAEEPVTEPASADFLKITGLDEVEQSLHRLLQAEQTSDTFGIVAEIKSLVPEYISNNSVFSALDKK